MSRAELSAEFLRSPEGCRVFLPFKVYLAMRRKVRLLHFSRKESVVEILVVNVDLAHFRAHALTLLLLELFLVVLLLDRLADFRDPRGRDGLG